MAKQRSRRPIHNPGRVLRDLVVMLADGSDCLTDLSAMRDQPDLFRQVACTPTAYRVINSIGPPQLQGLREARRLARAQAWKMGAAATEIVLDFDASLITAHSEKEGAAGNYKGGFGFHPLFCYLAQSGEALAGLLRPGNAGANIVSDHIEVLAEALQQLRESVHAMPILARSDSAGASHDFVDAARELEIRFSVGFDLTEPVREAILATPESAWVPAIKQDGQEREGAGVCELVDLDLEGWPSGTRPICRREHPHPGAQLSFTDHNGYRFQCFITDQTDSDPAALEARHRAHACVEDRIRCAKDTGLENLPFRDFPANQVWLELVLAAKTCWSSTRASAWRARPVTGAQETPLPASPHRRPHDQHWPPPDPAPATQLALDGRPAGSLQAAAHSAGHHLSQRLRPSSAVPRYRPAGNLPCPDVATNRPRQCVPAPSKSTAGPVAAAMADRLALSTTLRSLTQQGHNARSQM